MNPIIKFKEWYGKELVQTTSPIPAACCLATLGEDGYPNARFVALKEVSADSFLITGPIDSRKGKEIKAHPKAALTFWWTATERQVRIQGDVFPISAEEADRYFGERNREAQILSMVSKQGAALESAEALEEAYRAAEIKLDGKDIPRPENWSGFSIVPIRIEFLAFKSTRFHERILYIKSGEGWKVQMLQP